MRKSIRRLTAWALTAALVLPNASYAQAEIPADFLSDFQFQKSEEGENAEDPASTDSMDAPSDSENEADETETKQEYRKATDSNAGKKEDEEEENAASKPSKATDSNVTDSNAGQPDKATDSNADQAEIDWDSLYAPDQKKGGVEVVLGNALPLSKKKKFTVSVLDSNGKTVGKKVSAELEPEDVSRTLTVENIPDGSYTLHLEAPGFADYEQAVEIAGDIKTAEIYTDLLNSEDITYEADSVHPGAMLIGDVNGDGVLDEEDKEALLDALSGHAKPSLLTRIMDRVLKRSAAPNADLNGDGAVNLVDLQYYASAIANKDVHKEASLTSRVSGGAAKALAGSGTEVTGKLEQIFEEQGTIQLKTANDKEISEDNPVELGIALQSKAQEQNDEFVPVEQIAITTGLNGIESGEIVLETDEGELIYDLADGKPVARQSRVRAYAEENRLRWSDMILDEDDPVAMLSLLDEQAGEHGSTLLIDLGGQIAVKRVIIRITGVKGGNSLADISRVEFLNHMENRIPEPEMDIPQNLTAEAANKSFTLRWDESKNVTGYEVEITHDVTEGGRTERKTSVVRAAKNTLKVDSFEKEELVNGEAYEVRVQAVNGSWRSGYGSAVIAVPVVSGVPEAPDYVKVIGGLRKVTVTWKDMEDTDSYFVYWRVKGTDAFEQSEAVKGTSYEISGLTDETTYEVYVTGVNELGEGPASLISEAKTTVIKPAILPKWNLINESAGTGKLTNHIVSATHPRGSMVGSVLDADSSDSALGIVDDDYNSYYEMGDWDEGGVYPASNKGLYVTFDAEYRMNYITFAEVEDVTAYTGGSFYYYDQDGTEHNMPVASVVQKTDANGRKYYLMKLKEAVTTGKVRVGFTRYGNYRKIVIAEMGFYDYDSLEDEVLALYADDLHTSLKPEVTATRIEELQTRLNTPEEKSGEYHMEQEAIQKELDNAKGLLDTSLRDTVYVKLQITAAKDGHLGFSGLNAWQPLGVSAYAGERVVVYVGHNTRKTGENTSLRLVASQYHAESGSVKTVVGTLKVGRNEVTIPKLQSLAAEAGGALYVEYTGNDEKDQYAVRVSGGVKIPVLDLYGVTDESERAARVQKYVEELEDTVPKLEEAHQKYHVEAAEDGAGANRDYDEQNCIAGATDILLDQMMYSVSAKQILNALGSGTTDEKAEKLDQSLKAMDQMMVLFYQHKGLSNAEGAGAKDRLPAQHLNIRYMRMFAGAFMYAAGDHIGIEWGSVGGLATAVPVQADENGRYESGNLFGWGIAHEIGHNINQGAYAVAEITNNYFAQLTTARDTNDSTRFQYDPNVYEKVTSGTAGRSSNQATQLAMYWQLHIAYDRAYNFKTYEDYQEQFDNLFYARVDTYARDLSRAPAPGGVALTLEGDAEQKLMRLACAAAEKDLTEYFVRWGVVPNAGTLKYAQQFEKEERAIYYLTDDARVYEMENGTAAKIQDQDVISASSSASVSASVPNEVNLSLESSVASDVLLGYEIARYTYEGGEKTREIVGFAPADGSSSVTYQDHVTTMNNRVVTYEAIAVDKFGYCSAAKEIGAVRISHDGSMDKSFWTVTTNMTSDADTKTPADEQDPCDPVPEPAISRVIDNDYAGNTYTGISASGNAVVTISMNKKAAVSALKYTVEEGSAITDYVIEVSEDGSKWTRVREGSFENRTGSQIVYFENENKDPWVATYDAVQVRLTAKGSAGKSISITELDLLGPTGDSISFGTKADGDTDSAIGLLQSAYEYESGKFIPAGSLVIMGRYKGNPAYNVVLVYDGEGNLVGGTKEDGSTGAEQIILAKVPENGLLGETSDGTWIYWMEPDADGNVPKLTGSIRAELYRVDNALTNEGQRMVSDTMPMPVPAQLGNIAFGND